MLRTFGVGASVAVAHVYADGGPAEAQSCVIALQPLVQPRVWAQKVLKRD